MNEKVSVQEIKETFNKAIPNKTIFKITDYAEKNCYVVYAISNDKLDKKDDFLDGLYAIDKDTMEVSGFQPMVSGPKIYFNLPEDRVLYRRNKNA